uniref:ATP synthase F0 subunit 8 n=1 Tax=Echinoecus nipponicus TaxID=2305783 RepID=A0A346Q1A5_9EUCA|nr:ATP synthase F0 subunit 8 [Echinoecus nipponicus]AXR86890.1 ATP synthase F0 subunit 8 [Echinoecus nipponicus]
MPQMSPLLWLPLYFFFLISLILFLVMNFFIKPFEAINPYNSSSQINKPSWKL